MSVQRGHLWNAIEALRRFGRLWLLQVMGGIVLAALAYGWLWIPDAHVWQLAATALLGVVIAALAIMLHGSTILILHGDRTAGQEGERGLLRNDTARMISAGLFCMVLFGVACWVLDSVNEMDYALAKWLASWLSLRLQRPVSADTAYVFTDHAWWLVAWALVVLLWLPLGVALVCRGWRGAGWRAAVRGWFAPRYWLMSLVVFFLCGFLPWQLAQWAPEWKSLLPEVASAAARWGAAYVIAVTGWVVLLALAEQFVNRDLPEASNGESTAARVPIAVPAEGSGSAASEA
jgi:hypothetical protein